MTQIKAIAHVNNLTKDDSTDYYLIPQILATLGPDGIIERLRKREIATKNVDGKSFVETFLEECSVASAEGYNIVTSFFKSSIGLQGVVYAEDLGHPIAANRLKVLVNLTQGEGAKKAIEGTSIFAYEQTGAVGPIIQAVMDPTEMVASHLNPGSMVLIQGMRLALKESSWRGRSVQRHRIWRWQPVLSQPLCPVHRICLRCCGIAKRSTMRWKR